MERNVSDWSDEIVHIATYEGPSPSSETQTTASKAATAVMATPELLEMILLQMFPSEMLMAARNVSATWRAMIDTSPAIQVKLMVTQPLYNTLVPTPQLHDHFPHFEHSVRLNPALELLSDWTQEPVESPWGFGIEKWADQLPRTSIWDDKNIVLLSRVPSKLGKRVVNGVWRDLLLTEPALSVVHVYVAVDRANGLVLCQKVAESVFSVRDENGLRLGLIEDLVLAAIKQMRDSSKLDTMTGSLKVMARLAFCAHVEP